MRNPADYLDCCPRPDTAAVRTLSQGNHDLDALLQCRSCATFWFYRYHEDIDWYGHGDVQLSWSVRLTDTEALLLRATPDHTREDLSFLIDRPRWLDCDDVVYRVDPPPPEHADLAWYPPPAGSASPATATTGG